MKNKVNLFIALGIPLILVFGMIGFTMVKGYGAMVQYDVLFYSQTNKSGSSIQLNVFNGTVKQTNSFPGYTSDKEPIQLPDSGIKELDCTGYKDRLTFYKTNKNKSVSVISCEEVVKLMVYGTDEGGFNKSPDGYTANFYPNFSSPLSYFFGRPTPYKNEQKTLYFNNESNQDISELTIPFETGYIQKSVIGWVK
jgi:hypothetical protein